MERYRKRAFFFHNIGAVFLVVVIWWLVALAQHGESATEIELSASIDREEFPENETATLTVVLRWLGSQDAFRIESLSPPSADNLRIISSSSSVETRLEEGKQVTVRTYKFVLRGEAQGVATIGGVEVNYRDAETGEASFLETQPIQLLVAAPKAKRELKFSLLLLLLIVIVAAFLLFTVIRLLVARRRAALGAAVEPSTPTLEERLSEEVNLVEGESDKLSSEEFYSKVRSIALDYLQERHEVSAKSSTTSDVIAKLEEKELPQEISDGLKKTLLSCDRIRFGSRKSSPQERREILSFLREILEPEA